MGGDGGSAARHIPWVDERLRPAAHREDMLARDTVSVRLLAYRVVQIAGSVPSPGGVQASGPGADPVVHVYDTVGILPWAYAKHAAPGVRHDSALGG